MADIPDELAQEYHNYKVRLQRKRAEADEYQARADQIKAEMKEQEARLSAGPSDPHSCPHCFMERGETNTIVARTAADPEHFDRWACPKCGFYFDVRF